MLDLLDLIKLQDLADPSLPFHEAPFFANLANVTT